MSNRGNLTNSMIDVSHIWKFSSSSQPQLHQLCLAARKHECNNKWIQKFQLQENLEDGDNISRKRHISAQSLDNNGTNKEFAANINQYDDMCREIIDIDPLTNFSTIVDMCLKDKKNYEILVNNISISTIEKICNHTFYTKNLDSQFVEEFYKLFLPAFFKKEHSSLSLDLLIKAKETHIFQFIGLLIILLNEKDLPSNVLQKLVLTLNSDEVTSFMNSITHNDISDEVFVYNLFTIYLAYKDCTKTVNIQNYLIKKFVQIAELCVTDKTYGKFLLMYIQTQENTQKLEEIEKLVEIHRSVFKKPCINAINKVLK